MKHVLLSLLLLCCYFLSGAQHAGVYGQLVDEKGNPIVNGNVVLMEGNTTKARELTDFDGNYSITRLAAGRYTLLFSYLGNELTITNIVVAANKSVRVNGRLKTTNQAVKGDVVVRCVRSYVPPTIDPEHPGGRSVKTAEQIEKAPSRNSSDIASLSTQVYQAGNGGGISIGGGRGTGTRYVVDGVLLSPGASNFINPSVQPTGGKLSSGEINDFSKWTLWEDLNMESLKSYRTTWPFHPKLRYTVQVKARNGAPLANARVKMSNGAATVWEAITDNTGKAELWYSMFEADAVAPELSAVVEYGKERFNMRRLKPFSEGVNMLNTRERCQAIGKVDIALLVDATGSMHDEIHFLKAELRDILQKVKDSMADWDVQTGTLFYRDTGDAYLTKVSEFSSDISKTDAFIAANDAGGGANGWPEAVDAALEAGLKMEWRADATARLAFLVLDAPPHYDPVTVKRMQDLTAQYAARGIRLVPVVCSGSDKPTEYLMRSIALATNGTYLFLTDHSGIGGSHTAPTTDKYDVEYLNSLIYRVIHQFAYMPPCKEELVIRPDTSQVQQRTDSVTTISWHYYPNPTTGVLNIQHTHTSGHLFVTDITGKAILRLVADASGITRIDLSQYPSGMYAIRYNYAEDKWVTGKFTLLH